MKFATVQQIYIVTEYAAMSPISIRRSFLHKYGITGRKTDQYRRRGFDLVCNHF